MPQTASKKAPCLKQPQKRLQSFRYDALPARCVRMRFRVGPEHNNMFVIYSLGVTLAGNS